MSDAAQFDSTFSRSLHQSNPYALNAANQAIDFYNSNSNYNAGGQGLRFVFTEPEHNGPLTPGGVNYYPAQQNHEPQSSGEWVYDAYGRVVFRQNRSVMWNQWS